MSAPGTIRVLPVWQPWASLLASGAKRIETRAYPPSRVGLHPGERIGIHAAKERRALELCELAPFRDHLESAAALPLGAIIGTAILARASEMTDESIAALEARLPVERRFGDYKPGRWAWVMQDPKPLPEPVTYTGQQGAFNVPLDLLGLTVADVPHAAQVFVDSFDESPINVPAKWAGGGHMQADTPEALHTMAARLGLRREWFQTKPGRPESDHYDLTASKREQAIRFGATPINWRDQADIRRARAAARKEREQTQAAREAA